MGLMRKIKINILICIIILAGFCTVRGISSLTYSKIIKDDIKNISKLTATNIYSDISNQLTKPIFVALTMANDRFAEEWLKEEKSNLTSKIHQRKMTNYLNGLKEKYHYNSVFLVSDYSKNYYHFDGITKVVSKSNQHDKWYYNFLNSNLTYDLDVDTDEANRNKLSVFINCRTDDDKGKLLGVTGVGLEINKVQDLLKNYRDDFKLEVMLFDKNGLVQVHTDSKLIEKENVFQYKPINDNKKFILNNKKSISVYQYKDGNSEGYMIVKYIEDLDWYLLVKKDTLVLQKSFRSLLLKDLIVFLIVVFFIIIIVNKLVKTNEIKLLRMAKTDSLTGLLNRRGFNEALESITQNEKDKETCYVFVFDIDNFKIINDKYGHLTGDNIICHLGNKFKECLGGDGQVFRWGGDEFSGFILCSSEIMKEKIQSILHSIIASETSKKYEVSISMGITPLKNKDTIDAILKRADKALYLAKENGKNQYIIL